jgi:hypothetical protein
MCDQCNAQNGGGTTPEEKYPECEKLLKVKDEAHKLGFFLDWLDGQGIRLAIVDEDDQDGNMARIREDKEHLLAQYFEIDLDKVDAERRAMLDEIRRNK